MNERPPDPSVGNPYPGAVVCWIIRALSFVGLAVSGFLVYGSRQAGPVPGCGIGSGCDVVLTSVWSKWLSIPVALPGLVVYAGLFAASVWIGPATPPGRRRAAWIVLLTASVAAGGAALWFTAVQFHFVKAWCRYCLTVHGCGLAIAAIALVRGPMSGRTGSAGQPGDPARIGPRTAVFISVVGLSCVVLLVCGQYLTRSPAVRVERLSRGTHFDSGPGVDRRFTILEGQVWLEPHRLPVIGSADAPVVLVELFDYTCPHCKKLHAAIEAARARYGDQMAVVCLPVPLDSRCNRFVTKTHPRHFFACALARRALAVWQVDPASFERYHSWLFVHPNPPSPEEAGAHAAELVGGDALNRAMKDRAVHEQLTFNVNVYEVSRDLLQESGQLASLPQIVIGRLIVVGNPGSPQQLFDFLEKQTPLRPQQDRVRSQTSEGRSQRPEVRSRVCQKPKSPEVAK